MLTAERLVLCTRCEEGIRRLVARFELRGFGDGVIVGAPHEHDGVTDRCVHCEGYITEDTLRRGDNNGMRSTTA